MIAKADDLHGRSIKGNPIEVKPLNVVDCMLQEGVPGGSSHERVIDANGESRWGDPVDGEEKVHWLETLYVKVKVYAAYFVEDEVSDYIRALNLYGEAK